MWTRKENDREGVTIEDIVKKDNPEILYHIDKEKNMSEEESNIEEEAEHRIRGMDLNSILKTAMAHAKKPLPIMPEESIGLLDNTSPEPLRHHPRINLADTESADEIRSNPATRTTADVERRPGMKELLEKIQADEDANSVDNNPQIEDTGPSHEDAIKNIRARLPGGRSPLSIEEDFLNVLEDAGVSRGKRFIVVQFFRKPDDPQWLWDTLSEAVTPEKVKRMVLTSWYGKTFNELKISVDGSKSRSGKSDSNNKDDLDTLEDELDEMDDKEVRRLMNKDKRNKLQERLGGKTQDDQELIEMPIIDKNTGQPMTKANGEIITVKMTAKQLYLQNQYGGGGGANNGNSIFLEFMKMNRESDNKMMLMQQQNQQAMISMIGNFTNVKSQADGQLFEVDRRYRERELERYRQQLAHSTPEDVFKTVKEYTKMAEDNGLIRVDRDDPLKKQMAVVDGVKNIGKDIVTELKPELANMFKMAREDYRESQGMQPVKVKMDPEEKQKVIDDMNKQLEHPDVQKYLKSQNKTEMEK